MRENAEDRAKKLRSALISEGLLDRFSKETLRSVIKRATKYSDPRTIKNCTDDLLDFRYIYKCNTTNGMMYAINFEHEDFEHTEDKQQLTIEQALKGVEQP
ncbi:MAG: hypothetical protein FWC33_06055 [Candidatus Bathyarchaeota archaeon]|nr:hypothetical protein [Candidatus Termiticorpusculum sp.]